MIETVSNISGTLSQTLEQVGALCRTAGRKMHEARRGTADALNGSASTVRDTGEAIDELVESTAAKLDSTAVFVRNYDPGNVLVTFKKFVGHHPAIFITGVAAAGFLFGVAARRKWVA
jgi:hypothetical protein